MNIYPHQCRAARALLGWTQIDLASKAKIAKQTLTDFEKEKRIPYDRTLADIVRALEEGGVIFITAEDGKGPGVRLLETPGARQTK